MEGATGGLLTAAAGLAVGAEAPGADLAHVVFLQTTLVLVLAALLGFVGGKLRQPLIVSFIAVGILAGPDVLNLIRDPLSLKLLAEIGIAVLLFIVGLKLDLTMIRTMGRVALATGLGQVLFTSLGGFVIARLLGMGVVAAIYVAVALTFSSTIIIVKLLSDKREVDSLHGRIAIGFLIVQDLVVVLAMIALAAFGRGGDEVPLGRELARVLAAGAAFLVGVLVLMRRALPWLLQQLARIPELLVLFAVAWAVGLAAFGEWLGFSKEVGAFLAGVSIASTPFRDAIGARLVSLRDFLLLFFFIHLGAGLDLDLLGGEVLPAATFSAFVLIGNPLIVMVIMGVMGYRKRTGFLAGLTVAQISEFSLILMGLGAAFGHVDQATVGLVTLVGLITIGLSTYMILYSGPLYRLLAPALGIFERKVPYREETPEEQETLQLRRVDVLIFGLGTYGSSIVRRLRRRGQQVVGVDFDPQVLRYWREQGVPVLYGDMEDPDLLEHLPIRHTRWVLSAVPDRNATTSLVSLLRAAHFSGKLALTARSEAEAEHYRALGADLVLRPFADAAEQAVDALNAAMHLLPPDSHWPTSLREVRLEPGSVWAGKSLGEIPLRQETGASVLAVSRAGTTFFDPAAGFVLYPGDRLVLLGELESLEAAAEFITRREVGAPDPEERFTMATVDIPERCNLAGRTLGELRFRQDFGVSVIGIQRGEARLQAPNAGTRLEAGDRLIVVGRPHALDELHAAILSACSLG
ncbi:MAG: cation:proton antiporter [Acidobacteriota bacterium]|jgi:Kef-type K+ transport system membrane component KefB/Trk K+ transport system NAD-binding subunit